MVTMAFELCAAMAVLERTPPAMSALLAGLPPSWTEADEGPEPGASTPTDVELFPDWHQGRLGQ